MNAREYAYRILCRVLNEGGYASLLMRSAEIPENEIGFVSEAVYGTIRNRSLLEYQWRSYAGRTKADTAVLLDLSIYQLFFMSAPEYAVVNETVSMAHRNERKFVNAILRKVQKAGLRMPEEMSVRTSHPEWILNLWKAHYGEDTARLIAEHDQQRGNTYGRINTLKMSREELMKDPAAHLMEGDCFTYDGVLQRTEYFREGMVLIQDRNSQAVVRMLDVHDGMKALDACAAPGTKTQQIAAAMHNTGEIIACELHEHRTALINDLMEKTGTRNVQTKTMDSAVPDQFENGSFDRILIDAPCSGLGDLSHKPEIRWNLKPEDLDEITVIQEKILDACAAYLKDDGILVYSTCTLNRKENENRIRGFLQSHPGWTVLEEKTMFPFENDADGFYACKLKKTA